MTEAAHRKSLVAIWTLRVLLGLAFLTVGAAKLTGSLHTVQTFRAFGWGQWFRYASGALDIIGALLVLMPRWTFYGALLLTCTVGTAAVLSLTRLPDLFPALTLTLLAAILAWLTRPWARPSRLPV
jgi:putative oxidoreductase